MTLQEQQFYDKNKICRNCLLLLTLFVFVYSLLAQLTEPRMDFRRAIRYIICIWCFVSAPIAFKKIGRSDKFRQYVIGTVCFLFAITVFTTSVTEIYAIIYSIALIVLVYGKPRMSYLSCAAGFIILIFSEVYHLANKEVDPVSVFMHLSFSCVALLMVMMITRMQKRHNEQNLEIVEEGAQAQLKVSNSIVELANQLNKEFLDAKEVSNSLNEAMESTHDSIMEIVEGSKATAEATENQTSKTSDIQESINQVGTEATHIGDISAKVEDSVKEGVILIEKLKNQASEVAEINITTRETTKALNDSIKDVQEITETILGISSQTNLLALNASIEAARAGEAGKGFAVVADEIRALSESTREATEQIASIIDKLTKDAQIAANAMSKSADYAQKQNELIDETGEQLDNIKDQTKELHEGVIQVNESVNHVINANTAIMDSISNLSATSEEVAASTDTVLSVSDNAMEALKEMNDRLSQINDISNQMEDVASN